MATALDLGIVDSHRKIECGFALTNTSDKVWKVVGARSSCACMSVSVQQGGMNPGEVRSVTVVFNPAGMEGTVEKAVQVDLKPGKSEIRTYKADVRLRLGFSPSDAAFGIVRRSETGRRLSAVLSGYVAADARIVSVRPPERPVFDVSLTRDGKGLDVGFADGPVPFGTYAEVWTVQTTDAEIPEIRFPVSARVSDGFSVSPQMLTVEQSDKPCSRMVLLRPEPGKPKFTVLSAEPRPRKWGETRIVPRPINGWQVFVEGIDPAAVRQFSKRPYLEIKTDLPEGGIIEVPLRVNSQTDKQTDNTKG